MKKPIFLLLTVTLFFAAGASAQTKPAQPSSPFGPCTEPTTKYFPQQKIEGVMGQSVNGVSFNGLGCMFSPGTTPNSNKNITAVILSGNAKQISDTVYTDARDSAVKKGTAIHEGTGTCDRYFSAPRTDPDGKRIGYAVYGEKGVWLLSVGSTKLDTVSVGQLEDLIQYACVQASGMRGSVPPQTTNQPSENPVSPSVANSNFLFAGLGLLAAIIIFIMFWRKRAKDPVQEN